MAKKGEECAPKFTEPIAKAEVLARVAKLKRWGFSVKQIAKKVGVSDTMVYNYLKQIKDEYNAREQSSHKELVEEKIELLREIRREALLAWIKSKQSAEKIVEKRVAVEPDEDESTTPLDIRDPRQRAMLVTEIIKTIEHRLPLPAFMNIILDTIRQERELLGLDAEKNDGDTIQQFFVNWDEMVGEDRNTQDPIAARIEAERNGGRALPARSNGATPVKVKLKQNRGEQDVAE